MERNGNNNFKGPYKFYDRCKTAPVFREVENDETGSMLCSDGRRRQRCAYIIKFAAFVLCFILCYLSLRCNSQFHNFILYTLHTYVILLLCTIFYLVCTSTYVLSYSVFRLPRKSNIRLRPIHRYMIITG